LEFEISFGGIALKSRAKKYYTTRKKKPSFHKLAKIRIFYPLLAFIRLLLTKTTPFLREAKA
jgi:hypothetical protein